MTLKGDCAAVGAGVGVAVARVSKGAAVGEMTVAVAWASAGAVADGTAVAVASLTSTTICVLLQPLKSIIQMSGAIASMYLGIISIAIELLQHILNASCDLLAAMRFAAQSPMIPLAAGLRAMASMSKGGAGWSSGAAGANMTR